jgi:uncharacterized membrane protein
LTTRRLGVAARFLPQFIALKDILQGLPNFTMAVRLIISGAIGAIGGWVANRAQAQKLIDALKQACVPLI